MKKKHFLPKIRVPALAGVLTTLGGLATAIATAPELVHTTAGKTAAVVVAAGSLIQALTKAIHHED